MGYNLTIGNAILRYSADDLYLRIGAEVVEHPDDRYTGKSNSRSPSYTAWNDFCREAGIHEMFYGKGWDRDDLRYRNCSDDFHRETPLLVEHPGTQPLCRGDLEFVRAARIRREQSNDGRPPGFWECSNETGWVEVDNGTDPTLARLLWLEFWIGWALDNCDIPVLANS